MTIRTVFMARKRTVAMLGVSAIMIAAIACSGGDDDEIVGQTPSPTDGPPVVNDTLGLDPDLNIKGAPPVNDVIDIPIGTPDIGGSEVTENALQIPSGWQLESTGGKAGFSLYLPPGWQLRQLQGIDSHIGEIVGDGVRLNFDLGNYSNPLTQYEAPAHEIILEEIGGKKARLVRSDRGADGVAAVHFVELSPGVIQGFTNRLTIFGQGLTREQQETAYAIFRTVRRAE